MSRPCCLPLKKPTSFPLHEETTRPTLQPKDQLCSLSQDGLRSLGSSSHGSSSHLRSIQGSFRVKESQRWERKEDEEKTFPKKNAKIWVVLAQIQITRIISLYKFDCFRSANFQIGGCGYKCREHWKLGQLPKSLLNYLQRQKLSGSRTSVESSIITRSSEVWRSLIPDHSIRLRFSTSKLSSPPQGARLPDPKGNSDFFVSFNLIVF